MEKCHIFGGGCHICDLGEWMSGTKTLLHQHPCLGKEKGGCLLAAREGSNTLYLWSNFTVEHRFMKVYGLQCPWVAALGQTPRASSSTVLLHTPVG